MPTLKWIGKDKIINYHNEVPFRLLNEKTEYSVNSNETENLLIKGDNLEALKALLPYYYNRIKAIYIDPPYNTGNENWIYNDNVNSPEIKKWLGKVVGGEAEDLSRHDKWLCMMMPRLKLLEELLQNDGVIFVSIDENEQHHLRMLMDEIFGANRIATFVWAGRSGKGGTTRQVEMNHEYIECYAKNANTVNLKPVVHIQPEGNYRDMKGTYRRELLRQWGQGDRREDRPSMYFPIIAPDGTEVYPVRPDGSEGRWRFGESSVKKLLENDDLDFVKDDKRSVTVYRKIREGRESRLATDSMILDKGTASSGTIELKRIFGEKVIDNVKPPTLVRHLIELATYEDRDAIVLDSFAGSGTTAHAVLALNKEDGGDRKFILVELENKIAESITAERLKRVIQGYSYEKSTGEEVKVGGLGGGFKFLELGNPLFDKHKQIIGEPSYEDLAGHIYFTETRSTIDWGKAKRDDWYMGEKGGVHYFIIYEGKGKSELGEEFLEIAKRYQGKKVVYADAVMIDDDELERFDIVFKQMPYEIKTF